MNLKHIENSTDTSEVRGEITNTPQAEFALKRLTYKLNEVCQMLGVSAVTVRRWIKQKRLKRLSGVRHILVLASELDRFLKEELA